MEAWSRALGTLDRAGGYPPNKVTKECVADNSVIDLECPSQSPEIKHFWRDLKMAIHQPDTNLMKILLNCSNGLQEKCGKVKGSEN